MSVLDQLQLADWRRRTAELYAEVRRLAVDDPASAWAHWRTVREALYRDHPQSPVPIRERAAFRARHWPYDPQLRFEVAVEEAAEHPASQSSLPISVGPEIAFERIGTVTLPLPGGPRRLTLHRTVGYGGGLFLPFRDATNGTTTYGAGRYLLDTVKGADLGGDPVGGRLIVDANFAYHPSCTFDPRWSCPLAPPENRLDRSIEAGERLW